MSQDHGENFLAGIIVGAAVGAAIALLYAPQSGEKTRKLVAKKAKEAKNKFPEIKDKARKTFGELKEKGLEVKERAQEALGEAKEKAVKTATRFKKD